VTPREKFLNTLKKKNVDTPIFCPAIYDFKINFSNNSVSEFGQTKAELLEAIDNEIDALQSEVVTCGYDIYNIEAEAVGAVVNRAHKNIFPEISHPLVDRLNVLHKLPELAGLSGRMPLMIDITKLLNEKYKDSVYIRGAISGPFSMAGKLYDQEKLILDCMINTIGVYDLLDYCTNVILTYLNGFLELGLDIVVFDSLASPPLVSPEIYRDIILPYHTRIFTFMSDRDVHIRPLIMGGNTLPIIGYLAKTGANQLLLDYVVPVRDAKIILEQSDLAFRINIDPAIIAAYDFDDIATHLKLVLGELGHHPNLLLGTGILMPDTPLENIQFVRNFIMEHYRGFFGK
jgi:uroporphyrinogen decarboxylase